MILNLYSTDPDKIIHEIKCIVKIKLTEMEFINNEIKELEFIQMALEEKLYGTFRNKSASELVSEIKNKILEKKNELR